MIQLEAARGCWRSLICRIKILQDGLHFSAPQVPQMGHLGHLLVISPILGYLFLSTNEGVILCVRGFRRLCPALKILQDGSHFGSSQAAHLSCLSCSVEKQLILSCLYFYWIIIVMFLYSYLCVKECQSLLSSLENIAGWVPLLYLKCTSIEVLEVHIGFVPHFEVHTSINQWKCKEITLFLFIYYTYFSVVDWCWIIMIILNHDASQYDSKVGTWPWFT